MYNDGLGIRAQGFVEFISEKVDLYDLKLEESRETFQGSEDDWINSTSVVDLKAKLQFYTRCLAYWENEVADPRKFYQLNGYLLDSYAGTFALSPLGWSFQKLTLGARSNSIHNNFRRNTLQACNAVHAQNSGQVWCPVSRQWIGLEASIAAHIFPYRHGQHLMDEIFDTRGEMFGEKNGLILSSGMNRLFDRGFIAFVPSLEDEHHGDAPRTWTQNAKAYVIKVFNKNAEPMKRVLINGEWQGKTYAELDGCELLFRSGHRPRARYLFYHYSYCLYRKIIREGHCATRDRAISDAFGTLFWHGQFLDTHYLRGYCKELDVPNDYLRDHSWCDDIRVPEIGLTTLMDRQAAVAGGLDEDEDGLDPDDQTEHLVVESDIED